MILSLWCGDNEIWVQCFLLSKFDWQQQELGLNFIGATTKTLAPSRNLGKL